MGKIIPTSQVARNYVKIKQKDSLPQPLFLMSVREIVEEGEMLQGLPLGF